MIISANSLVFNEYGDTLLVRRDDTRTLAPPGGAVEIGELPPRAAERETEEETGLEVRAVRLVGLYHLPVKPQGYLFLCFRAIQRGGTLRSSSETPQAGFTPSYPLPQQMLPFHREQVERGLAHSGGPPYWGTHDVDFSTSLGMAVLNRLVYPWLGLRRRLRGEPAFEPPPAWQLVGTAVLRNAAGEVLWWRGADSESWRLPAAVAGSAEAPWDAASRAADTAAEGPVDLQTLHGIYPAADAPQVTFVFGARGPQTLPDNSTARYFPPNSEPPEALPGQKEIVQASGGPEVTYRLL